VLCRQLNLFTQVLVAIDGSKLKAVNNRDKNFTSAKMKRRMAAIDESIERYLSSMDTADRAEPEVAALKKGRLQDKIEALKQQMERLKAIETQMNASPDKQVSLTDPDARSMKNREGGIVGYNVQTAVDAEHHLIVAHEVVTDGVDRDQLGPHGRASAASDRHRGAHRRCRPRVLQERADPRVHEVRDHTNRAEVTDVEQPR
jgi:hypothetical protein